MERRANRGALGAALLVLASRLPASAAIESGVEFADRTLVGAPDAETRLELCGTALQRVRRLFKGYAAALYRRRCQQGTQALRLGESPVRLELSYFWRIRAERFGETAEKILRRNLDVAEFGRLEPRLRRLHTAYRSVEPGDRYALTYIPGRGTELALNGRRLALIDGEDFARAYFGIWLGEQPIDERVRDFLLGEREEDGR